MKSIVEAPSYDYDLNRTRTSIFLAGSIEQGLAEQWQDKVINQVQVHPKRNILFFNPRRNDYRAWEKQTIDNPYFRQQVEWEIDHLKIAHVVFMYFDPNTKSPISLLELGFCAKTKRMIVVCPDGFWRKGNVEVVCNYFGQPLYSSLENGIVALSESLL